MTNRLYYGDSFVREFDATVDRVETRDSRTFVSLDRTGFYPTSGGQPFDTGVLGGHRVLDVTDDDAGVVWHVVEPASAGAAALEPGQSVHGSIDWPRRLDHMQQHTGQHVLSAAFDKLFRVRTVSFHLGADVSTIDLAREVTPREVTAAEDEANRIVWEDRPVHIRYATGEEAAKMPLRKEPKRGGTLRLIDVEGFDLSACGGTHVPRTGAIGIIAVASWERFKGGQRLEFLCGGRALVRFRALRDTTASSTRLLSVTSAELPGAIERLMADAKEQKRNIAALQTELARYKADEMAAAAEATDRGRLVLKAVDADANGLKTLAAALVTRPQLVVVLVSAASPALVVVARSQDVAVAAHQVLATLTSKFGGRGGGRPELAQGGGLDASSDVILQAARAAILSA